MTSEQTKKLPSGVYLAPRAREAVREAAKQASLTWFELNLARVASKREFLTACAKILRFPEGFGGNWDALADGLKDLCADSVVNCRNCASFSEAAPDDYATALEVLQDAASYWSDRTSTFVVLVDAEPGEFRVARFPGL